MNVLVLSDLHVDARPFKGVFTDDNKEDIVIIPGDIGPMHHFRFESTIRDICSHVRFLLFVPGNHEFYGLDVIKDKQIVKDLATTISNFILLDNDFVVIDGVKFIGSTMWTDMEKSNYFALHACKQNMNDFWIIRNGAGKFTPEDSVEFHKVAIAFIEEELLNSQYDPLVKENVVITHHAPSFASIVPKYRGDAINAGFASELSEMILNHNIKYWIHGHMHSKLDYMIGSTRVICNPRGYNDKENPVFKPKLSLTI